MTRGLVALATAMLFACAARSDLVAGKIVDLSHAFDADTIYWPTEEGFVLERGPAGVSEAGYWYAANRFRSAEHGGTHIDAPSHFSEAGQRVDEIPVHRLLGPAVVIDVRAACEADPDYQVVISDLEAWERAHGVLPQGAIVLLRTGFGRHWPDRARYLGTTLRGPEAVPELHFPGLAPAAAHWLVARRIRAVGLDTASIDRGQSKFFQSHQILSAANIPAFENLAALGRLPAKGFTVVALPMKIRGGSGGPLRAIAILP